MEYLLVLFDVLKTIVVGIWNCISFILGLFKVDFLSKNGKNNLSSVESNIETQWGSPVSIHDLPTLVNGLTGLDAKPISVEFYPNYAEAVFSLPFHKMPKTVHCSLSLKGHKMARWQLYFFKEATFLLEREKAYMVKHHSEGFSFTVGRRFNKLDESEVVQIPVKDRLKLAYANALYDGADSFQLQSVYNLELTVNGILITSLQYLAKDDVKSVWISYYKAKHGSDPDMETTQKGLSCPVSFNTILTPEESSEVQKLLGLKDGVKGLKKIIKKYSCKPSKKKSRLSEVRAPYNESPRGSKISKLEKIWKDATQRHYIRMNAAEAMVSESEVMGDIIEMEEVENEIEESGMEMEESERGFFVSSYSSKSSSSRQSSSGSASSKKATKTDNKPIKRDTRYEEERVEQCKRDLEVQKQNRDTAKQNGNYKKSSKNYRKGDKVGTLYDAKVWDAEDALKRAKEALARARSK